MTPPTPAHTHIWDGTRTLPDWLTGHRWTAGQLVIRTPDGDTRPQAGWWLIGWTDGSVTAATPTVAERVYGDDGIASRLARAEAATDGELRRQLADAIRALGKAETELADVRAARDRIAHASNVDAIWCLDQLDAALAEPGPVATQAAEPTGLRDRIDHTLRTTPNGLPNIADLEFIDHHGPGESGYLGWCALCTRDVDALTEALLAAVTEHLDIGEEQAWCKTCRRAWNSPRHRCESDAEQRVQRIAELRDQWLMAGPPPLGTSINRWWDKRLVELNAVLNEQPGTHRYLSTGCYHGDHAYCQSMTGLNGAKRPASCKFCQAACQCGCHGEAAQPGPA